MSQENQYIPNEHVKTKSFKSNCRNNSSGYFFPFFRIIIIALFVTKWNTSIFVILFLIFMFSGSGKSHRHRRYNSNKNYDDYSNSFRTPEVKEKSFNADSNKYCTGCRTKLDYDSVFCSNCGTKSR